MKGKKNVFTDWKSSVKHIQMFESSIGMQFNKFYQNLI